MVWGAVAEVIGCCTKFLNIAGNTNWPVVGNLQIPLDTERTATGFLKFLKSNAAIPFEAPELPEEPETNEEEHISEEYEGDADQTEEAGEIKEDVEAEDLKDEL